MVKFSAALMLSLPLLHDCGLRCQGALAAAETSHYEFPNTNPLQLSLNESTASGSTTVHKNRHLQGLSYQARFKANFQVLKDPFCLTSSPVIHVICKGANIQILNISHPTILCSTVVETGFNGTSYISCENSCVGAACETVYLAVDLNSAYGPFGAVEFQCSGPAITDVEGSMLVVGNANEQCATSSTQGDSRIFHVAQLAVACPSGNTTRYMYDDFVFECLGETAFAKSGQKDKEDRDVGDENRYTCFSGDNCNGAACTIDVKDLYIQSDVARFQNTCVEPSVDSIAPPSQAPVSESESSVMYTIRFEAAWGALYDVGADSTCSSDPQSVFISCSHGNIRLVNASSTIDCTTTGPNAMECSDNSGANVVLERLTAVQYECSASAIPKTKVEYPETSASCRGNTNSVSVTNAVQLGLFCTNAYNDTFYFSDVAFECSEARHQFDFVDQFGSDETIDVRFTCLEEVTFQSGQSQTIPSFAIESDQSWLTVVPPDCYTLFTQPASPLQPTSVPIAASSTTPPVIPTDSTAFTPIAAAPTSPQSKTAIPAVPVADPASPTFQGTSRSSSGDGESGFGVGVAVGGAAVAIVFVGLLAFFILRRKGTNSNEIARTKPVASADLSSNDRNLHNSRDNNALEPHRDPFTQASNALYVEPNNDHYMEPTSLAEAGSAVAVAVEAQSTFPRQSPHLTGQSSTESSHPPSRPFAVSPPRALVNAVDLDYKDQARPVVLRPSQVLFEPNGVAIGGTAPQTRVNSVEADSIAMAIATPLDVSSISNQTALSGGSNSAKSRGLEP